MKTQNPLIGRSTKSKGADTFYTLNGQNIVRNKPLSVSNPRTPAQVSQRVRFTAFTEAANSLPENELNALIPSKQFARNRRSTLQSQLAPAYGAIQNPQSGAIDDFIPTFDITKVGDLGTGEVGYVGELENLDYNANLGVQFTSSSLGRMIERVVDTADADNMAAVLIAKDGCVLQVVDLEKTLADIRTAAADEGFNLPAQRFDTHGNEVYAYIAKIGDKLQLIGLGTFSVAKRKAGNRHNIIVQP